MSELQRITTQYVEIEDRVRVSGELDSGETVVLWMSQRLLIRLLPHLFAWLEKQSEDSISLDIAQNFAQEAAKLNLKPEAPVEKSLSCAEWLVEEVDIGSELEVLRLRFRAAQQQVVTLTASENALRQWLIIVQALWVNAQWPDAIWPTWIRENISSKNNELNLRLH